MVTFNTSYKGLVCIGTVFCLMLMIISASAQEMENVSNDAVQTTVQAAGDPYTVDDVVVDVTAENAVQAREKAFEEAQIKAYKELAARFLTPEEMETYEAPDLQTVSALVKDFEVTNEKLSAVRYKGTYKIRFSHFKGSSAMLPSTEVGDIRQVTLNRQGDILIIPFFEANGQTYLWQDNPFMNAWVQANNNKAAGRAIIPVGDLSDMTSITEDYGLNYDPAQINAMRLRYQAKDAVLLIASPEQMYDGTTNITVSMYEAKPYGPTLAKQFSIGSYQGEVAEQFYNRVITQVALALEQDWKRPTAVTNYQQSPIVQDQPVGPTDNIIAQLNFNSVREWVESKRKIENARGVKSVEVKSLSPRTATLAINFNGGIENFQGALMQQGIGLNNPAPQYPQNAGGQSAIYQLMPLTAYR
jgi:hypothetical protein